MSRSADDFNHERQMLDEAHAQNEVARDSFVALAHTALFAASIAFVGEVTHLGEAIWIPSLLSGWAASVIGLLALTFSFVAARRAIDARREALNDDTPPKSWIPEALNNIALWSFPLSLLCLFSFVTANVVHANGRQTSSPANIGASQKGHDAAPESALPQPGRTIDRRDSGTARAVSTSASANTKEVAPPRTSVLLTGYGPTLEIAANWAAILTALVAVIAGGRLLYERRERRLALEVYLRDKKVNPDGLERYTVMHLMAHLAMTEEEVLHAGFHSKKVKAVPGEDKQGRAVRIYFQYDG
jgi:hypothetical protein